ncbi:MAG: response regulator [Candidatus Lernaella stagnicola]|nr:response regulator [Candidatus Lernaella stagnicola]
MDRKTVLIVDDDVDYLTQMRIQLEAAGFTVIEAESEAEASKILAEQTPDIAIVDLMMENMDGGFVLCHRIKKRTPHVPVIMVTAVTSETGMEFDTTAEGSETWLKADAVLTKPARFEQLKREIDRLLTNG